MFTLRCGIGRISPHSFLRMNVSLTALARIRAIGEVELGIAIAACHSDVSPTPASVWRVELSVRAPSGRDG